MLKIIISISICFFVFLSGYQYISSSSSEDKIVSSLTTATGTDSANKKNSNQSQWSTEISEIIQIIREQYSEKIHQTQTQAKLIYIRAPLIDHLRDPIQDNLKAVLASAFPGYENSILDVWSRIDEYQEWLISENRTLMDLNALNRSGMLWNKRNELFPLAASDIWSDEQDSYETAQLNFHSEVEQLDQSNNISINEKIDRLQASFQKANNVFTQSLEQQDGIHSNTIASVLFGLKSVQEELQQLDPEQRQLEIDSVRRELGYDEGAILKMSKLDRKREQRWSNGYAYMESREQLLASTDQVSSVQLNDLRHQYFGNSAATIEKEEVSGFYRFERPRYYGRN